MILPALDRIEANYSRAVVPPFTLAGVILDLRRRVTDLEAVLAEQFEQHSDNIT